MSTNNIVRAILATKNTETLLNWDEEVKPTPIADLQENIKTWLGSRLGWPLYSVEVNGSVISIAAKDHGIGNRVGHIETILTYDCKTLHEIAGRVSHAHFDIMQMHEIKKVVMRNL